MIEEEKRSVVVVCCPPKVGSTALISSLRISACESFFTLHCHGNIIFSNVVKNEELKVSDVVKNKYPVYLIDIFRTPVENKLSEFFHEIGNLHFNNKDENILDYSYEKITTRLLKCWPFLSVDDFYHSMFVNYGATPIPENYDWEKTPYYYSKKNNIHFIKLRLNDVNQWGNILTKILNKQINMIKDYDTTTRVIGNMYSKYCKEFKLTPQIYENLLQSPLLNLYMTENERNKYLNYWMTRQCNIINTIPFSLEEWKLYKYICNDNQYYIRPLVKHYIDDGCLCMNCKEKRRKVQFFAATISNESFNKNIDYLKIWHTYKIDGLSNNKMMFDIYNGNETIYFKNVIIDVQLDLSQLSNS